MQRVRRHVLFNGVKGACRNLALRARLRVLSSVVSPRFLVIVAESRANVY